MQIAWTRVLFARSEIWTGSIVFGDGEVQLVGRRMLVDRCDFHYLAFLETQDFRPPDERELIFTPYACTAHQGGGHGNAQGILL